MQQLKKSYCIRYRTGSGRLIMLRSSFGKEGYTEALAYSDNGDITGEMDTG